MLQIKSKVKAPLKRLRKSIWGSSGPGIDSIPVIPDMNPACAVKK